MPLHLYVSTHVFMKDTFRILNTNIQHTTTCADKNTYTLQRLKLITIKLCINELDYNEQLFNSTQINLCLTNPSYNYPELYVITEFDCIL